MFVIKSIEKPTSLKLLELIDEFNSHLNVLSTLGRPITQWDDLLVHLLVSKLDSDTKAKWNDEANQQRLDTFNEVCTFLNKRAHLLEGASMSSSSKSSQASKTKHHDCATPIVHHTQFKTQL